MQAGESSHPRRQATVPDPSRRNCITLEPLRTLGPDALLAHDHEKIHRIRLCEIEVTQDTTFHEVTVKRADDLFRCAATESPDRNPIPEAGTITRAVFVIQFIDSPQPATVHVAVPDLVTTPPGCDRQLVERWLAQCRFQNPEADEESMEMP